MPKRTTSGLGALESEETQSLARACIDTATAIGAQQIVAFSERVQSHRTCYGAGDLAAARRFWPSCVGSHSNSQRPTKECDESARWTEQPAPEPGK